MSGSSGDLGGFSMNIWCSPQRRRLDKTLAAALA
jgi:hypothetical protein